MRLRLSASSKSILSWSFREELIFAAALHRNPIDHCKRLGTRIINHKNWRKKIIKTRKEKQRTYKSDHYARQYWDRKEFKSRPKPDREKILWLDRHVRS